MLPFTRPFAGYISRIRTSSRRGARLYNTHEKNLDVSHAHFLAEASPKAKWTDDDSPDKNILTASGDDLEGVTDGQGKLALTSSHLFKLILPLGSFSRPATSRKLPESMAAKPAATPPPTVFLLHPAQPLSHISRLIGASLGPAPPAVSFRSTSAGGQLVQWSPSTDLGDFVRAAARAAEFTICLAPTSAPHRVRPRAAPTRAGGTMWTGKETLLRVSVPTFGARTRFLQRRLERVGTERRDLEALKARCDAEAGRGARHMAVGGLGMLVVYWAAVARLTFWDYGWDTMEPITYLSGLSTVVLGYLWFLYQGREVSYASVLARSISARREALYKARGMDIERWVELRAEEKTVRAEIARIARDYEDDEEEAQKDKYGVHKDGDDIPTVEDDTRQRAGRAPDNEDSAVGEREAPDDMAKPVAAQEGLLDDDGNTVKGERETHKAGI